MKSLILKYSYRLSLVLIIFIGQNFAFSQNCNLTVSSPSPTQVCPGTAVNLSGVATVYGANQSFNFDGSSSVPSGWSVAGGGSFGAPCGPYDGNHFWASTAGSGTPFIETAEFDVCSGGNIVFDMVYSVQGGSSPCEGPDEPDEGVSIEYSTDGGVTWTEFVYFHPNGTTLGGNPGGNTPSVAGATPWTTWSTITVPIPPGAVSTTTTFRWSQANSSGTCCDNWGIDNIFINAGPCLSANINWSTGENGVNNIAPVLTTDSCFTADVYDDFGVFLCSTAAPICFTVFNPSINGGPDVNICNGATTTLSASGGSGFTWNNGVTNGVAFTPPLGTTTYTVSGTDVNGCPATDQVDVTVTPIAPPSMNPAGPVCIDGGLVALSGSPAGGVFTGTGVTGTNFNPATAGAGTHTITYTYTTGGCTSFTTRDIIVNPLPVVTINPQANLCSSAAAVNLVGNPAGGTFSGTGMTGSSFNPATAGVGTHTITYTYTDGNGCTNSNTVDITVDPLNTIAPGTNQTVCVNSAITDITLATTSATGATFSGLPAGVTGSWAGNVATISGTPTVAGTYNYTVTTTGGCPPATTAGTITVDPLNTIAAGTNQTVCINSAITDITLATTSATGATFAGLPAGVTGSWAGDVATISGTPTVAGTFNYTVTTTGGCPPATTTGTITVDPLNTIAAGTNQTVCINSAITDITLATTSATGATFAGLPAGVTGSWAGDVATISGTPTVAGTYNYTVTTTGGCPPATTTGTITVDPLNTIAAGTNQTVCINSAITNITLATTSATGATFSGLPAGVTGSWAGNVATISGTPTVAGTFNYTVTTTGGCPPATTTGTITVDPLNTIAAGTNQTVCINSAITNITLATTSATGATFSGLPAGVTGSWAGNVATISGTPTVAGTFNYTVTTTGGCPPATTTGTITVDPLNTIAAGTNQTVCVSSAITNITLATTSATGATFSGLPAGVTGSWAGNVATISGTPTATGTFNYTVTTTGGCPPATTTGTITVNLVNTIAAGTNQTVCINSAITDITLATTSATGANFSGLPAGVTGSWAGDVATISGTPTVAGTFNYTVTTIGGCPPATTTGTITVDPLNTIAAGTNQTVCINSALTNITLATTGATGATFSGLPAGVTGSWAGDVATISGTPTVAGTFNYTVTTTGGCPPATTTGTITVDPLNTIAAGTNQTVCANTAITTITLVTTSATGATFSGLPAGVTGSWAGNVATISGTPTVAGTYNYTVTTTGGCPPATTTGTITVDLVNTIAAGTNQTVCVNSAITDITLATTSATGATFAGLPAGVTGSWAGDVATISGTPTVAGTFNYTVTTTGGCPPAITTGTITVDPLNTIAAGTNQTVCVNSAITDITLATTSATGATFSGLPAGVTGSWAGDVATISGTPTVAGTYNYTVTTTGGCPPATTAGTITVDPLNTIAAGTNQTVCINSAITDITLATTSATGATFAGLPAGVTGSWAGDVATISGTPTVAGTFNYTVTTIGGCPPATTTGTITVDPLNTIAAGTNQTVCINSAITNITLATTGATGATFSGLPAGVTGSWAGDVATISGTPTVAGTFNYTVTTTGGCPPATTTGTITVDPLNTIAAGTNQTVCANTAITTITLVTTSATGATFAGLPAGVTGSWAGNVATISGTPTVAGTYNYTVTTTGGCPPATTTGTITVDLVNTIAAGTNQTVCINSAITNITLATTSATGATFSGLPAGVTGSWAGDVATISGTPTVAGTFNYTVTTTGGCPPAITTGTITVDPLNTIAAGTNQTVCVNSAITDITLATTSATGATFSGLPAGVTGSWAGDVATISGTPTVAGTYNYTVTTTGGCPPATTAGTITVDPLNTIVAGTNQTVCINSAITDITLATTSATGATFAGLPAGVTGSWAGDVATISGTPTVAGTFNYTVTTIGGCPPATTTGTITVDPLNTIAAGTNQTVCVNSAITDITLATTSATGATFAGLPAGVTGSWAGDVATISGTPTVAGTFNYTVTTTGGCPPAITTGTITVDPLNTIAAGTNQTVCANTAITNITLVTTSATGATFAGLPAGVTGSWAGNVATISGTPTVAGTYNYTVTTTGGCPPATTTGTITVNLVNTIAAGTSQIVCINSAITDITLATTSATGATFSGLPAGVTGSWAGDVATISGTPTVAGTFNYTVTTTGGCPPAIATGTITVNPLPIASTVGTTDVCQNDAAPDITFTGANGTAPYTFTYTIDGAGPYTVSTVGASSTVTVSVPTGIAGTFVYALTGVQDASSTTCSNPQADSETVIVNPLPTASTTGTIDVCQNDVAPDITFTGANGTTPYTFTYTINGGAPLTVSSVGASSTATVTVPTGTAGTFVYALTGVQDASSTTCSNPQVDSETVIVNPLPTATTMGTTDVCQNGAAPNITFTGANGTAPYTFTYTLDGAGPYTVSSVGASSTATVSVPTGTAGTFVYALTGVQDASSTTCSNPQVDSETITVNPLPTGSTVGTTDVCQNGVAPDITFTGANGSAPYTFTYTINGGAPQTVSSVGASSTATVSVPTGTAGTFVYALTGVQDGSVTSCAFALVDTETILVNPLPTASTVGTTDVCQNDAAPDITFTGANGTAPYTFTYTINGGAPLTVSSVGASATATVSVPTGTAGTFVYALTGVQDASSTTCSNPQADSETILVNPLPIASTVGTTDVCQNDAAPDITFTGANGTAPYTFTYTIDGAGPYTVSTVGASSTVTVSVPTGTAGTFVYALTGVQDASSTTCSNPQADSETVIVNPLPTASTTGTIDVCQNDVAPDITFTGANGTTPYTFTYTINGGAPLTVSSVGASSTATVTVPTGTAGTFVYALTGVQDASSTTCSNPQVDSETVIVNPLPTATTMGTTDVCQNGAAPNITFTGANGTAPYTFTYTLDGAGPYTVSSVGASSTATVSVPTGTAGTFVYALTGVQDASSTTCSNPQVDSETITVNPLPTGSTVGTTDVCQNGVAPDITFTGANGSAPYTFTYTINGGAPQTVSSVGASSTATVSVPTGTAGTFVYALTGIQDGSSTTCSNPQADSETVIVNPLPTASTVGTTDVCQNDAAPDITFTGANGTAPYTFTYTINGGAPLTVSTVGASSTATVSVPTGTAGTFVYALTGVQDASSTTCSNPQADSETVIVNPLPTASTTGTTDVCQNDVAPNITFTGANGTAPYTFAYNINGGGTIYVSSIGASSTATVSVPTGTPGTYVYNLISVQDASSTTCSNPQVDSETVIINALPTASTSGTTDICEDGIPPIITFTGANGTTPYTFTYTINGGAPLTLSTVGGSSSATITVPTGTPGTYVYDLVSVQDASSTTCSNPQVDSETVTVNPLPTATIGGSAEACHNDVFPDITFTGGIGTAPFTFTYTINGGAPQTVSSVGGSSTATVPVPTGTPGTFVYELIGVQDASTTACSNPQSGTETVIVYAYPPIDAGVDQLICENASTVLSASNPMGVPFYWDNGVIDGISFSPSAPTVYTVTADNNGCISTDDVLVDIESLPLISFYADTLQGCEPLLVNFTSTSSSSSGLANCVWDFGDGNQYVGCGVASNTFDDAGYYSVTLTATSNTGCVNSATYVDYVYVEAYPVASFSPGSSNLTTISTLVNFENTSTGASSYVWNFGDLSAESTQVDPSHTFPDETSENFTVRLIASSPIGCVDTAYGFVDIIEELIYYVPNTFTPDGDDYNETFKPVFTSGYDPYSYTMLIFNRWGEVIWESHDTQVGWNGHYGGIRCQDGTYTWKIEFKTSMNDERIMDTGHVNIIR